MICASLSVPSVVTTIACVSPLVNNAEPCVLSRTPIFTSIGLTVVESRPSILTFSFTTLDLTILFPKLKTLYLNHLMTIYLDVYQGAPELTDLLLMTFFHDVPAYS